MAEQGLLFTQTRKVKRKPRARYGMCPDCKTRTGIPVSEMPNGYNEPEDGPRANLACAACGQGWHANAEDVDRAERADRAFWRKEGETNYGGL